VREPAIRRIDDRIDRLFEQVAANDLETSALAAVFSVENLAAHYFTTASRRRADRRLAY